MKTESGTTQTHTHTQIHTHTHIHTLAFSLSLSHTHTHTHTHTHMHAHMHECTHTHLVLHTHTHTHMHTHKLSSPLHPLLVLRDVFGIQKLAGGRVLAQRVLALRASVHERLPHHRQAGVSDVCLVHIKGEVWVLDDVHPKPQR